MPRKHACLTRRRCGPLAILSLAAGQMIASEAPAAVYSWSSSNNGGDWYQTPWTRVPPGGFPPSATPGNTDTALFGDHTPIPANSVEVSNGSVTVGQIDAKGGITSLFGKAVYTSGGGIGGIGSGYDQHFNLDVGTINIAIAASAIATLSFADQGAFVTTTSQSYIHSQLNVGKAGAGYMDISSGYRITLDSTADANIGSAVGSSGYLSVIGSQTSTTQFGGGTFSIASKLVLGHTTRVGAAGVGTLLVSGGASVIADDVIVGEGFGTGNGTIIINSIPFGSFGPVTSAFSAANLYLAGGSLVTGGAGTLQMDSGLVSISNTLKFWGSGHVVMSGGQLNIGSLDEAAAFQNAFQFNGGLLTIRDNGFTLGFGVGHALGATMDLTQGKNISLGSSAGTITVSPTGTLNLVGGSLLAKGIDRQPGGYVTWTKGQLQLLSGMTVDPVEGLFNNPSLEITGTDFGDRITLAGPIRVGTTGAATVSVTSTASFAFAASTLSTSSDIVLAPSAAGSASVYAKSKGRVLASQLFIGGESFASTPAAAGGNATLTVEAGGTVTISGRTHLYNSGTIILNGGNFETGSISYDSSPQFVFNSGTFQLNNGTLFVGTGQLLGANVTINSGKTLIVNGTTHVLPSGNFAVTSGVFHTGTFINEGVLDASAAPGGKLVFHPTDKIKGNGGTYKGNFENGYWAPGQSPGITNLDGVLDLTPDATLEIELAGPATGTAGTDFDQLFIVDNPGNTFKPGGTLKVILLSGAAPGTYRIVKAGGSNATIDITRTFANLVQTGDSSMSYTVEYTAHFVDLHLTAVPEPGVGLFFAGSLLLRRRRGKCLAR